ncbi:MAG TPA: tol-pal system protein YbgF [Xanthomonadaceae bacterium]|nr:tol-pal system protein YbgF [Xanthomonadaceae bacterium]
MRPIRTFAILLTLFVIAAPAFAQRQSLADRVVRLEQQAANAQPNVDLLNQIGQLKTEVQALRGQLEELQQQLEQQKQTQRSQYLDLDSRLGRLTGAAAPATPPAAGAEPSAAADPPLPTTDPAEPAPRVHGDAGAQAKGAAERARYEAAFAELKAGRYAQSARAFQSFLEAHPDGTYAPNALYWLGESYYATQNYALALPQFRALRERYPTHDKAPGALLKVGLTQYGLQELDAAERSLSEVTTRYPGSDAARTADDRLRAIRLGRLR